MALDPALVARIDRSVERYGAGCPTPPDQTRSLLAEIGVRPPDDYVEFVSRWGGCFCGVSIRAFHNADLLGLDTCVDLTKWARCAFAGLSAIADTGLDGGLVIATDEAGNPILIAPDGEIRLLDHDHGTVEVLAPDLATLLADCVDDAA
ncbi:SMI1/KNR4 family protein [Nocardioides sp. GXZ039]|uniref:SMI1/KNR4 family protein n=1 Tax=Nocardioides sp. GXZ039 TaxID=3136018 RepID=UPI0030F449AF